MSDNNEFPRIDEFLSKADEDQLVETDGAEAGGWTFTSFLTRTVCPTGPCTQVQSC